MANEENADELLGRVIETLQRHAEALKHGVSLEASAREWLAAGFTDEEEINDWLSARCFSARGAQTLDERGITPEQAALRTTAGRNTREDTIGYKITNGELTFDEAKRIITNAFWNS